MDKHTNGQAIVRREPALTIATGSLDVQSLGQILAKSGYFQDIKEAGQAIIKILAGQELGIGAIAAMTGIYIVKGRVTLSANIMASVIKRSGRYDYRIRRIENDGCTLAFFENGQPIGESTFTMADAKSAGLAGDNWRGYPRNMCFARAMSNGAKWYCPDLWGGPIYTPDELQEDSTRSLPVEDVADVLPVQTTGRAAVMGAAASLDQLSEEMDRDAEVETPEAGLATPAQVRAIYLLGNNQGLSQAMVDTRSVSLFAGTPAQLTETEAADLIARLQPKPGELPKSAPPQPVQQAPMPMAQLCPKCKVNEIRVSAFANVAKPIADMGSEKGWCVACSASEVNRLARAAKPVPAGGSR